MEGLTKNTQNVFEKISLLPCIKDYILVGGTALSLQINKRLSEDLDFCKWTKNIKKDKPTVDWVQIEKELSSIGKISKRDILGFEHVNFILNNQLLLFRIIMQFDRVFKKF